MTSGVTDPALAFDGDVNAEPEPRGADEQKTRSASFRVVRAAGRSRWRTAGFACLRNSATLVRVCCFG
jgi:hypothetical protein